VRQARHHISDVIVSAWSMIDAVLAASRRAPLQRGNLIDQCRVRSRTSADHYVPQAISITRVMIVALTRGTS